MLKQQIKLKVSASCIRKVSPFLWKQEICCTIFDAKEKEKKEWKGKQREKKFALHFDMFSRITRLLDAFLGADTLTFKISFIEAELPTKKKQKTFQMFLSQLRNRIRYLS